MVYEMQPTDPTLDVMMCFVKPAAPSQQQSILPEPVHASLRVKVPSPVRLALTPEWLGDDRGTADAFCGGGET
jgi:hypothetical protein